MNKILKEFEETIDAIKKLKDVHESKLNDPISKGKWSIREIVGHLYYWDKYNLEKMVPIMANGVNLPQFPNHDQHNQEALSYLRDRTVESIVDAFIETRKELIDSISKIEEDVRFTIGKGKRQFSGKSFIKIFLDHDKHHLQQINGKLNT
ncbi:DinB family protein [Sporosarcina highlanderae]|uniref:DinB family protein n=1 Tax=Sporosarcina highlanderae TaxID=3035916 RepID=A0ABT8JUE1_9BACL|nr:DinB family protein [Sporosarcina highlanderae]MDN4608784.1 DinB family protein [Sporosarcina highlanderae]